MSQWRIFDAYKAHQEKGSRAAEDQAKARSAVARRGIGELASTEDPAEVQSLNRALGTSWHPEELYHCNTPCVNSIAKKEDLMCVGASHQGVRSITEVHPGESYKVRMEVCGCRRRRSRAGRRWSG